MKLATNKLIHWQTASIKRPEFSFIKNLTKKFPQAKIYLVGGAVRDLILIRETKDFDFVVGQVNAKDLEKFLANQGEVNLVGKSFGVFKFVPKNQLAKIDPIDIALPRTEHAGMSGGYRDFNIQSDKNLPIEDDLGRRDFTVNALAWDLNQQKLIDQFDGLKDLKNKIIRAIGRPEQRFQEDYTRMLRAIRLACQLDFTIEKKTLKTINEKSKKILIISRERINEEFTKIIMSPNAEKGLRLLAETKMLKALIPELAGGIGVSQNKSHIYDVFEHSVRSLDVSAQKNFKLEIRLAALLHDIAKPQTKIGQGQDATFYDHDQVGAKMTAAILRRLNYPNEIIKKVIHLVRYHMFYYALDTVSDAGVRRLLHRLGKDNIDDFINLRVCDRLGMGRPKAKPYKLIQLEQRLKEVQLEPISPKMLKIDGHEIMQLLKIKPGPKIGLLLNALLGEILEEPAKNKSQWLKSRAQELNQLRDQKLKSMHPDLKFYEEERKRLLHRKNYD